MHVVVNRMAHRLAGPSRLATAIADAAGGATVHETRSLAELSGAAEAIARDGAELVVLAGGDGSYMAGLSALARAFGDERLPALAFAPGGTVGTVARNWGLRGRAVPYARALVHAAASGGGELVTRPTLRVRDSSGGDRRGFIFGAGLVASFFERYYASPHRGTAGAARIVARIFAGSFVGGELAKRVLSPVAARLTIDGEERPAPAYSLVAASVVRDLGLSMRLLHRAGERPDRVHVVASALPPARLGPQMPLVLLGRPLWGRDHVDALARELRLAFDRAGEAAYVLDGDVIRAAEVTVTPGPEIRLLAI